MNKNFTSDCLEIRIERETFGNTSETFLMLYITSDYANSSHKSALHVDGDRLAKQLEEVWKSIKTKKIEYMNAFFSEIDHYDDETDIYYTPSVFIKRGLKKAKLGTDSHGAIPKDWTYNVVARFKETSTVGPIIEVIKKVLSNKFTLKIEKEFTQALRIVLQKTMNIAMYYNQQ